MDIWCRSVSLLGGLGDLGDHKNLGSIAKSYLNKDKMLGAAIHPLPDKPTDEQIKEHRAKVGCPETVEGYEVAKPEKLPDGMVFDDDTMAAATKFAHDNHVPKGIFEGLAKLVFDGQIATFKRMVEASAKETETATNQLKGKHGAEYDKVVEMANRFYDLPGNDEVNKAFTDLMAAHGLDTHPAVVEFFNEAYKLVKEDTSPEGGGAAGRTTVPGQLDYTTVVGNSGR